MKKKWRIKWPEEGQGTSALRGRDGRSKIDLPYDAV